MTTRIGLRPATPADEAFLQEVYASTRADELAAVPWSDADKAAFVAHQFAAQSAHYAQHYTGLSRHVIRVGTADAGRLLVARWPREIRIVDIALLPRFRGSGAGSALLGELIDEARAAGTTLSIHVERHNRAMGLYTRLGFRPAGDEGVHLRMEWVPPASRARRR